MDKIEKISRDKLMEIAADQGFNPDLMLKDYYITAMLFLIQEIKGIYFKGGTALQKIFLNYPRLSEDIDFTLTREIKEVIKEITGILENSSLFEKITKDKDVAGFTRLIAHYRGFSNEGGVVFIDLNKRAKLLTNPERHKIIHFYKGIIPEFSFNTLSKEEMIAEKIMAAIGRNKPRDHYDIYEIIKAGIPINIEMVKDKCKKAGAEFSIIKIFNQAKKLKNRWDQDTLPLIRKEVSFHEVMKTLSGYFKLKEEKEKLKNR